MKQLSLMIIFLFALAILTHAQNERKFVRQGNKYYGAALKDTTKIDSTLFNKAEIEYRKALDKKPTDPKWNFNLSNSLYKQMKFEESAEKFKEISELTTDKVEKSHALHNMGNSLLMNNKLDESIEAYKQALRNNPKDLETKYNLLYAMNLKKKQEEEQKKQDKDKDKNKDQDKDKDKDQNKDQDKKDQDQQKQDQQQQPQNKISKQNAEQMLQALENSEKKTQEKVKKVQALRAKSKQVEKDW
ncbi:MAG: tetratricopeptide repeat protein [Prolixibacteraceae bacterium]|nr:tetratricopeptide repeat protein [Prolixibacteraceae bacterium]